jgi:WD40 repeat protein
MEVLAVPWWIIPVVLVAFVYPMIGIAMIVGAVKMLRLKSYGWATTAAILALLPCSPAGVLGLVFGIWALIVLGHPNVRAAFARASRNEEDRWRGMVPLRVGVSGGASPRKADMRGNSPALGRASLWIAILGFVLPVSLAILVAIFVENRDNRQALANILCGVLLVALELVALGFGIAGRHTASGKAGLAISCLLLSLFGYAFWEHVRPRTDPDFQAHDDPGQLRATAHETRADDTSAVEIATLDAHQSVVPGAEVPTHVAFSADGKRLIALVGKYKHNWQLQPRKDLGRKQLGEFILNARSGTLSPDGETITLVRADGTAELWAIDAGARRAQVKAANALLAVFSHDEENLAVAPRDAHVRVMDARTFGDRFIVGYGKPQPSSIRAIAFSPDGSWVATGDVDGSVEVSQAHERFTGLKYFNYDSGAKCVALDQGARRVAAGFADGTVRVWDVHGSQRRPGVRDSQHLLTDFGPHPGMTSVALSPDGRLIATGSSAGTVKLWEPRAGARK